MRSIVGALISTLLLLQAAHAAATATSTPIDLPPDVRKPALPFDADADVVATSLDEYSYEDGPGVRPTAVYDISAHVVVLPDGSRLEAHSGLAERVDDPRFIREHMRGATPPALYDLTPRKHLFHGVAALRLTPIFGDVFGRTGLLTHSYMLHGRPESNGCVVFRDYDAFLRAFRDGRIRRLRVVPAVGDMAVRGSAA